MIVGLTGAIGSGKSTVAGFFREHGFECIDCDAISHEINDKADYVAEIRDAFGEEYVKAGAVDRAALARKVFYDAESLRTLTRISHRYILRITLERLERFTEEGKDVLIDAPLLFESELNKKCDITVSVTASKEDRLNRALTRGGIEKENIVARMNNQPPNEFYSQRSDFTIKNDGNVEKLRTETEELIRLLKGRDV
ncbi:MAG: dephospho-CoA kinase [Clostridia bacterium]|nr:dephospho-CoA kinase [Clostridia bacterium]